MVWSVEAGAIHTIVAGDGMLFAASPSGIEGRSAADGTIQWQLPLAGISAPLLWDTGWLIAGGESGDVVAIRAGDGSVLWRQTLSGAVQIRPSIAAERLYVPLANSRVVALDLFTGATIWETRIGGAPLEILPLDDRLFLGARDRFFYCLSLRDGRRRWRWPVRADIVGAPVVDESHVYLVSLDNVLRALDRGNGAQRWRRPLPMRPGHGPVRVGEVVIVSGLSPDIRGYRTDDGGEAGHYVAPSELAAAPHPLMRTFPDGPLLVILTGEGDLYGVRSRRIPIITPFKDVPGTPVPLPPPPKAGETGPD
jgi:outer membrane protein assembly factor BamB